MSFIFLLFIYIFLTILRYSFLPAWPLNFVPVIYLAWQNQKPRYIWYLLLMGLVNDFFLTQNLFGLTSLIFISLGLVTYFIDHIGKRSLFTYALSGLLLTVITGISWPSAILIPASLSLKLYDRVKIN